MNDSELHEEATRLADTHSPYMLAKMLLIEYRERVELAAHIERVRSSIPDATTRPQDALRAENVDLRKELAEAHKQLAMMRGA